MLIMLTGPSSGDAKCLPPVFSMEACLTLRMGLNLQIQRLHMCFVLVDSDRQIHSLISHCKVFSWC